MSVLMDTLALSGHHSALFNIAGPWDFSITIMRLLDSIISKARSSRQKIVLAEGEDARVLKAAQRAQNDNIAECILLGREPEIRQQAAALGLV